MGYKKIQGYTLIELIVVIGMMLGITTIMVINGADSRRVSNLENAARQLEAALTEAQAYGNSGKAFPPGGSSPEDPKDFDKGYGVYVTPETDDDKNTKIIIYGGLGDLDNSGVIEIGEGSYIDSSQDYETIYLDGGVIVSEIRGNSSSQSAGEANILFKRGELSVLTYSQNQAGFNDLTITLKSGDIEKKVVVYSSGLIYIDNS